MTPNGKVRTINQRRPLCNTDLMKKMSRSIRTALSEWLGFPSRWRPDFCHRTGIVFLESVPPCRDSPLSNKSCRRRMGLSCTCSTATGRHTETRNALTNAIVFAFAYDAHRATDSVTDGDGDATDINRDPVTGIHFHHLAGRAGDDAHARCQRLSRHGGQSQQRNLPDGLRRRGADDGLHPAQSPDRSDGTNYTSTVTYNALGN